MACEEPIWFVAVQIYVPASFLSAFVIVKVWSLTVAFFPGSSSKSLVQDTTGGGYRKHHISAALCVYRPRGERNVWTSCYRKEHTVRRRLVTQTVTSLNFSDTLEYAVNQEVN